MIGRFMWLARTLIALSLVVPSAAQAEPLDTAASQAFLLDLSTGSVLLDKNGDQRIPPSSMAKMMSLYLVFEDLKQGKITPGDLLPISQKAWAMQGSKMYVEVGKKARVEDLIRGVTVQSGNDATIVLAEGLAGSEEAFVQRMNEKAAALGLSNTFFTNATGWPDEKLYSTAKDLATLARRLSQDFPEYYHFFSEKEFTYNKIKQGNRNPLLYRNMGADGIKTGHTEAGGFGLAASVIRQDRRLLLVLNGLSDMQTRADESSRLIEWGFKNFSPVTLTKPGHVYDNIPVIYGTSDQVSLTVDASAAASLTDTQKAKMVYAAHYTQPLKAPVHKGDNVGDLVITFPDSPPVKVPLIAAGDIPAQGFFGRLHTNIRLLFTGS